MSAVVCFVKGFIPGKKAMPAMCKNHCATENMSWITVSKEIATHPSAHWLLRPQLVSLSAKRAVQEI
jgi:hypothetical protein